MFTGFMADTWAAASMVAVIAGVVGFFVVLRGAAFAAHAIPNGAFAGAAAAVLLGISPLAGLTGFAVLAAASIAVLARRGRPDVATALALVLLLATGAALLAQTGQYAPEVFALLFGDILGVSGGQLPALAGLAVATLAGVVLLARPLLLSALLPEVAEAQGVPLARVELAFLLVLALATALTVPVVGTLLVFSLMIGPPAAARAVLDRPLPAVGLSVGLALATVWAAVAASYLTNWPVGFYVGVFSAAVYALCRGGAQVLRRRATVVTPELGLGGG